MKTFFSYFIFLIIITSCNEKTEIREIATESTELVPRPSFKIQIKKYCLNRNDDFSNFFVINPYLTTTSEGFLIDSDADGVINSEENIWGSIYEIAPNSIDSNADNYSDLIVYRGGYTTDSQQKFPNCNNIVDSDKDQLSDCEEILIGTDHNNWDSDGDTIPDHLEVFKGLNPLKSDGNLDSDKDGISNLSELIANTPIRESNSFGNIESLNIKYEKKITVFNNLHCQEINISNIPIYTTNFTQKLKFYVFEKIQGKTELKIFDYEISEIKNQDTVEIDYSEIEGSK